MLNQTEGIYQFVYPAERKEDCVICGQERRIVEVEKVHELFVEIQRVLIGLSRRKLSAI